MPSQYHTSKNQPSIPASWIWVTAVGFLLGQQQQQQQQRQPPTIHPTLEQMASFVDTTLIPLYTTLVFLYVSLRWVQQRSQIITERRRRRRSSSILAEEAALEVASTEDGGDQEQPINMSGKYKLISIENFDAFLEVQGVPWALRRAACKVRPVHRIIHKGNRLTIKIEGIIVTQTTYIVNGPPVEIKIKGRVFMDRMTYLDNGKGIRGIKQAVTENYDIFIDRVLSEDGQRIVLTSKAVFKDERETVESKQIFQRIE